MDCDGRENSHVGLTRARAINQNVYVLASQSGKIFTVNTTTMKSTQLYDCEEKVFSRPLVIDNFIVFGCRGDKLIALRRVDEM